MRALILTLALLPLQQTLAQVEEIDLRAIGAATFEIPESAAGEFFFTGQFFFEVLSDEAVREVRVDLIEASGRDVDIVLRAGSPFEVDEQTTIGEIFGQADLLSAGISGEEFLVIHDATTPGLRDARYYVGVLAFPGAAGSVDLRLEARAEPSRAEVIPRYDNPGNIPDCDTAPWNDTTPFTPVGGNNATTLGEARRNAFDFTAELLSEQLSSPVPIRINACWFIPEDDPDDTGTTLAGAFFSRLSFGAPGVPDPTLIYSNAATSRLAGTNFCNIFVGVPCEEPELFILFNPEIDGEALGDASFYYGLDQASPGRDINFVSVALHEVTHGLGFADTANEDGELARVGGTEAGDAYLANLVFNDGNEQFGMLDPGVTDADRAAAFTSNDLQWIGNEASVNGLNVFATLGDGLVEIFAPDPFNPGSSVAHLSSAYCSLMRSDVLNCPDAPFEDLGIARPMLHAAGWATAGRATNQLGLFFDRSRNGHGYSFELGGFDAEGQPIYVLTFYSYDFSGNPEWFQAVGTIDNGSFHPIRNADGNGFPQFLFDDSRSPPQQADPDLFSQVALSFNEPERSASCQDEVDRSGATGIGSFQWAIDRSRGNWCSEYVVGPANQVADGFGGLWFAGEADTGWGFSIEDIVAADGSRSVFVLLYVYAADGTPVWFFGTGNDFVPGQPLSVPMFQRDGFSRSTTNGALEDTAAGNIELILSEPSNDAGVGNFATVNVTYLGSEGGDWIRNSVPIQRLSLPRP